MACGGEVGVVVIVWVVDMVPVLGSRWCCWVVGWEGVSLEDILALIWGVERAVSRRGARPEVEGERISRNIDSAGLCWAVTQS